ncbi:hypothetical protein SAM23877_4188 [Streptomyces ambofaciens ATCC 23877]|uniref:Uncharacterized protein n=1 Tax=Streptomyces ambofaciens (strain ATCC 23877 / 3486 / DSM 40053 / JCM 4204 / NBRC 12836 / NRRL B-2516) TaxID=278992 RepID=A0A0K2AW71_STRA7|nr:hypothetical protein SAM23877_4188 [Streptomyces ambofaciens ATCC 23877]
MITEHRCHPQHFARFIPPKDRVRVRSGSLCPKRAPFRSGGGLPVSVGGLCFSGKSGLLSDVLQYCI